MTLNLKDLKGLKVFNRLADQADVLVENFRRRRQSQARIEHESLRHINPKIVYGSISCFGQEALP